jgi:hypothetical protein
MAKRPPIDPKSRAEFLAAIKAFAETVKKEVHDIGCEQMRLMCRDAMTFTPPMPKGGGKGLSVAAYKAGAGKIAKDVKRIFIPQDEPVKAKSVYLRQIINAVKGGDRQTFYEMHSDVTESRIKGLTPIMRKIMEDTDWQRAMGKAKNYLNKASINGRYTPVAGMASDPRAIHERYKNAVGGRWKKGQKLGGPQYFVESQARLQAYIAARQLKVGRVKAGWATILKQIPNVRNRNFGAYDASWVDANRSSQGVFRKHKTARGYWMEIENMIGNINGVADEANTKTIVYGLRVRNLQSAMEQAKARLEQKKLSK